MRLLLVVVASLSVVLGQEGAAAKETLESVRAENEWLKAQLAQLRLEAQYELRVCASPDLMQARLAALAAEREAAAAKSKSESKADKK